LDEAFGAADADAVSVARLPLAGAGVEGGDEGVAVDGGEAFAEGS
jgi:hypothetical protein